MRKAILALGMIVFLGGLLAWKGAAIPPLTKQVPSGTPEPTNQRVLATYGRLPLSFEANQGQTDEQVKFLSRGRGYTLFLTSAEAVLAMQGDERQAAIGISLLGSNPNPQVTGLEKLPGKSNYFIGNDPANWRTNVPQYAKVRYKDVYRGIDLVYYGNQQQLEYDFIIAPGADPSAIRIAFKGAEVLSLDDEGNLTLHTRSGKIVQQAPALYQRGNNSRRMINGRYVLEGSDKVRIHVENYDLEQPLIIDPVLSYSTYLGGSDRDAGQAIAVDAEGNVYLTGFTSSANFPTANSLQPAFGGSFDDAFVAKLNPQGSVLLYSTYLGGSGGDRGFGIAVDSHGNAYVTGSTVSTDFPTMNPSQPSKAGTGDAFVAKLDPSGSALLYSTYLGGSGSQIDSGADVAVDSHGNAYVTGTTWSTDFPILNPLQAAFALGTDIFVTKFNFVGSMVYSTYLGGNGIDTSSGIVVDVNGNAYIVGSSDNADFPTTPGAFQTVGSGPDDAIVAKLDPSGSVLVYATYVRGSGSDFGRDIALDATGNAYITGLTRSSNFPTTPSAFDMTCGTDNFCNPPNGTDAFVSKLNTTGSALVYSTFLGGSGDDLANSISIDSEGNVYVLGITDSMDFPTVSPFQASFGGSFVTKLNATGSALVYSTYLGGDSTDRGRSIAVDAAGNAYVTGLTGSSDFPTTPGVVQPDDPGFISAFVAKFCGATLDPTSLTFVDQIVGTTSTEQNVTLTNLGSTPLTITSVVPSGDFDQTNTCTGPLAVGESCTISVTFTPTGTGTRTGDVTITDDACGNPYAVALSGTGINPVPTLTSLSPSIATVGGAGFTLVVNGSGFVADPVVRWNGTDRTTTFVGLGEVQAAIPASDIAVAGTAEVTVFNPAPSGGASNPLTFTINTPPVANAEPDQTLSGTSESGAAVTLDGSASSDVDGDPLTFTWTGSFPEGGGTVTEVNPTVTMPLGTSTVTLVVNDGTVDSEPDEVSITITDFAVAVSPDSVTVTAGQAASYTVTVTPQFGAFDNSVSLACAALPALSSCSFSAGSVTPGASSVDVTLTVSTTALSAYLVPPFGQQERAPLYALWLGLPGLALVSLSFIGQEPRKKKARFYLSWSLLLVFLTLQVACGGGGMEPAPQPRPGTPTGTHIITITGTSGSLQGSTTATLIVQ